MSGWPRIRSSTIARNLRQPFVSGSACTRFSRASARTNRGESRDETHGAAVLECAALLGTGFLWRRRHAIIDAHTSFAGFGVPMTPAIFFGDRQKWGITGVRMCPPNFEFSVDNRPDGSLVATAVTITRNWDSC